MYTIEVDFEVFKELTSRRQSEADTGNNVIRRAFNLGGHDPATTGKSWLSQGVEFHHGTELRGTYKKKEVFANIDDGQLMVEGKLARNLSHAVKLATGTGRNGWDFWHCKRPGESKFTLTDELRKKKP